MGHGYYAKPLVSHWVYKAVHLHVLKIVVRGVIIL
jgi:hypothetical protein